MNQRRALVLRHVAFEDLGSFAAVLEAQGFTIAYREAGLDDLAAIDPLAPDLMIVLGGPIGVCEGDSYPFIADELRLLERRFAADLPTFGICLGAQLMAKALGAAVYPGSGKEIGWGPLLLTEAGRESCLAHLAPEQTEVLHWHGDTFDLPAGAIRLASTPRYPNQAFARGRSLGLQFHAEATQRGLERWFIGHACEIAGTDGIDVAGLRRDTARWAPRLAQQGTLCLDSWLRGAMAP
ncbi:MAG: synthase family protein [Rhodospirillales bacterium]|jgi:GMP synthase (glutamine-hydrolysing)|nr:synthase family protein [Rhodospirillales bacterium]